MRRSATQVSRLTAREYQSSMNSVKALMNEVDRVRMSLNDQDPAKKVLGGVMKDLLNVQNQIFTQYEILQRVDV